MLDIENYDQWKEVCDDDELIFDLYNLGVRPGTEQFKELLGVAHKGETGGTKNNLILIVATVLTLGAAYGVYRLAKFISKKIKQLLNERKKGSA